jgi:hypothetical protein
MNPLLETARFGPWQGLVGRCGRQDASHGESDGGKTSGHGANSAGIH